MVATNFASRTGLGISSSAIDAAFQLALDATGGDASNTLLTPRYPGGGFASTPREMADIEGYVVRLKDHGGNGNNIASNTAALTKAANIINAIPGSSEPFPVNLLLEPGLYMYDGQLPTFTAPTRIISPGPRSAALRPVGNFDALTFQGGATDALSYCGLKGVTMDCAGMTGGNAIVVDTVSSFGLEDTLIYGTQNGISLRQCSNAILKQFQLIGYTGYGLKLFGTNGSRNGGLDLNNVVTLRDATLCGSADGSRVTNGADSIWSDGASQTLRLDRVACINAGRGLRLTNTPGVAAPLCNQFIYGSGVEFENMANECMRADVALAIVIHTIFAAGAGLSNIYLGSGVSGAALLGGEISSAWKHGVEIEGADDVDLAYLRIYNNDQYGATQLTSGQIAASGYDGVYCNTTGDVRIHGGQIGKNAKFGETGYTTEAQRYAINNAGSGYVSASGGAKLLGNAVAATAGTIANLASCRTS